MASKVPGEIGGLRCQAVATHVSTAGPLCTPCADRVRQALLDPNTLGNVLAGRVLTEGDVARLIVEIPPEA